MEQVSEVRFIAEGKCPECHQHGKDYHAPSGSFAPEAWATMREIGIDPSTGHKATCTKTTAAP